MLHIAKIKIKAMQKKIWRIRYIHLFYKTQSQSIKLSSKKLLSILFPFSSTYTIVKYLWEVIIT